MQNILLIIHIVLGFIALTIGALAAGAKKGKGKHSIYGNIFVFAMLGASLAGFALTFIKPNPFLQSIALFTIYMTLMGFYAFKASHIRKFLPLLGMVIGLFMLYTAFFSSSGILIVAIVFGVFQLVNSIMDAIGTIKNRAVLHASRIGGAYIASTTAFMVTSLNFVPWYVGWFLPSIVGTYFLTRAIRNYLNPQVSGLIK